MKRIVITGGQGQLGKALANANWLSPDVKLHIFDKQSLDITNQTQLAEHLNAIQPNLFINAAAYTAVDKAEEDQASAYAVNAEAVKVIADYCQQHDIPVIHISTDYVFSGTADKPYSETDEAIPCNVYGESKLAGEKILRDSQAKHIILRTSGVFSADGNSFVKSILRAYLLGKDLRVVDDQLCGPTWAKDLADIIAVIADKTLCSPQASYWGTFHVSSGPATSWHGFTEEIIKHIPEAARQAVSLKPIPSSEYPTPAQRPAFSVLNCDKLKSIYGIEQPQRNQALKVVVASLIDELSNAD